jgi:hypothetical protein
MPTLSPASLSSALRAARPPARIGARLLAISPREVNVARRGFACEDPLVRRRLELIGETFLFGYHAGLEQPADELPSHLDGVEAERRGFAYEGAAMALALLGILLPWRWRRLTRFLEGPGSPHVYMVNVGIGWALAALRVPLLPFLSRLDPVLRWLAVDGVGFYHGYFHPARAVERQRLPRRGRGYVARAVDQGLGRALWFVNGAEPSRILRTIEAFAETRRADLWSGVGLAAAYAGGLAEDGLRRLRAAAGRHASALAQGAAFAAKARERAGNGAPHTERACGVLCGRPAAAAAAVTDDAWVAVGGSRGGYEAWRVEIQERFQNARTT